MYLKTSDGKHATAMKGSKKLREILSTDMISPPLGDLRHISHVGRGGPDDTFGDTSFLQKGSSTQGSKKNDGGVPNGSGAIRSNKKGSKKGRSSSVTHEQTSTLDRELCFILVYILVYCSINPLFRYYKLIVSYQNMGGN